jgi:hypothetical protein
MKELGNLAIVCVKRRDTLLQLLDGMATVYIGRGPERTVISTKWYDDDKITKLIYELNHGKFKEMISA